MINIKGLENCMETSCFYLVFDDVVTPRMNRDVSSTCCWSTADDRVYWTWSPSKTQCKRSFFFFVIIDNEFFISQLGFDVRLTNSAVRHAGRIDLRIHGIWGTLYSHYYYIQWTSLDRVICRQLNFSDSILAVGWSVFGQGTGPQWYRARDIHCLGDESNLQSCTHSSQLQLTISGRAEDLSVICKPSATQARGELLPYFWADWITAYSITFKLVGIFF